MSVQLDSLYGAGTYGAGFYGGLQIHPSTLQLYLSLPEHYQVSDEPLGYPFLRWISLLANQSGAVDDIAARMASSTPDGASKLPDLLDPDNADDAWLPFALQWVGVNPAKLTVAEQRTALASAKAGNRSCTKGGITAVVQSMLVGDRFARVYDHAISKPGDGGQWDVLIVTREPETPDWTLLIPAVIAHGQKPSGVTLHYRAFSPTYDQIRAANTIGTVASRQAMFPTLNDITNDFP